MFSFHLRLGFFSNYCIYFIRIPNNAYYAVAVGREPGIYRTWEECRSQIIGYPNNEFKKFPNKELALQYLESMMLKKSGTYKLMECEAYIKGIKNNVYKSENKEESAKSMDIKSIVKAGLEDIQNLHKIKKQNFGLEKNFYNLDINNSNNYILEDPNKVVVIFIDGASLNNGKPGAQAGFGVYWGPDHPLNTSQRLNGPQTNNRAEIHAAIHALNQAKQIGAKNIKLYTDSQFLIRGITDWINKWKINGWKLTSGQPVINKEDFIQLDAACHDLNVEWIYVQAHAKNKGNEEADKLAVAGASMS